MDQSAFISELSKLRTSATFLTLKGYRSSNSEVADFNIVYHISYKNALLKSIDTLNAMSFSNDLERQAKSELLTSFQTSLANMEENPIETRDDGFTRIGRRSNRANNSIRRVFDQRHPVVAGKSRGF